MQKERKSPFLHISLGFHLFYNLQVCTKLTKETPWTNNYLVQCEQLAFWFSSCGYLDFSSPTSVAAQPQQFLFYLLFITLQFTVFKYVHYFRGPGTHEGAGSLFPGIVKYVFALNILFVFLNIFWGFITFCFLCGKLFLNFFGHKFRIHSVYLFVEIFHNLFCLFSFLSIFRKKSFLIFQRFSFTGHKSFFFQKNIFFLKSK